MLALGSWRTFEEIPREQGVEVMSTARACGIDFLDDARAERLPPRGAVQLPYNVALRSPVEDDATTQALAEARASVVASWAIAGGALTGKYAAARSKGRMAAELDRPSLRPALRAAQP